MASPEPSATITTTPEALLTLLDERDAKKTEEYEETTKRLLKEALGALDPDTNRSPVQTGESDRGEVVDERLVELRAAAVPEMRVVSTHQTEGWERAAVFHYKHSKQIPEAAREMRNPETDWWIKEWAVAQMSGDTGRQLRAAEFLIRVDGNLANLATLGLELVPEPLSDIVYVQKQLSQVVQPLAMNFTSASGNLRVPAELALANATKEPQTTDGIVPVPTLNPAVVTFQRLRLDTKKGKVLLFVNDELLEQNAFEVVTLLAGQAGKALGRLSDFQIINSDGTGDNHTDSLLINTDVDATTVGTTFTDVKVRSMWSLPIAGHRSNGIWLTDVAGLRVLNQLEDSGGKVIFTPADAALSVLIGQGQGVSGIGTMLNRPVYEVEDAGGRLYFGDPEAIAVLGDGKGIRSKIQEVPGLDTSIFQWTEQQDSLLLQGAAWARTSVAIAII